MLVTLNNGAKIV